MSNRKKGSLRLAWPAMGRGPGRLLARLLARWRRRLSRSNRRTGRAARPARRESTPGAPAASPPGRTRRAIGVAGVIAAWLVPAAIAVGAFASPLLGVRAYEYVMSSGHFHVREVLVEGDRRLGYEEIRELLGVTPGTHVLTADLEAMGERLAAHPWVSWAQVRRELPDRLVVEMTEHEPAAIVAAGDLYVVDRRGRVFARVTARDREGLPIITGIPPRELATEAARDRWAGALQGAINVTVLYREMGLEGRWPIAEIRLDGSRGLTFVLSGSGTEVVLGQAPYRDKLFRLEWVLESLLAEGKTAEYVVLDAFTGIGPGADDGRVIVKADLASGRERMMELAAERARHAERHLLGLPPDPDLYGPRLVPGELSGVVRRDEDEDERRPALTGGRPALEPIDDLDGEE